MAGEYNPNTAFRTHQAAEEFVKWLNGQFPPKVFSGRDVADLAAHNDRSSQHILEAGHRDVVVFIANQLKVDGVRF